MQHLQQALNHGVQALNSGQLDVAEQSFGTVLTSVPDEPNATFLLGVVRQKQGIFGEAENLMRRALPRHPVPANILNSLGNLKGQMQEPAEAIGFYEKALAQQPNFPDAHFNMGLAYERLGYHDEAASALRKACTLKPTDARFWTALGGTLKSLDQLEDAVTAFDRALEITPGYFRALHNKGVTLRMLQQPEEALKCYTAALTQAAHVPELHFNLACAAYDAGDIKTADASLQRAIGLQPDFVMAHETLNKMYWEHGDTDRFTQSFEKAIKHAPDATELRVAYADQLKMANRANEAAELLAAALKEMGPRAPLHHSLGMLYGQTGHTELAVDQLAAAVRLSDNNERYRIDMANFLIQEGDYTSAMQHLDVAEQLNPDEQEMWALKGLCWRFTGDEREAWLNNYDLFVQAKRLDTPDGYDNFEHFITELRSTLIAMHDKVQTPLDQSVRGGTQTPGRLLFRPIKVIQDYRGVLEKRVREYLASLPNDPTHPFLRRKAEAFRFSGSWSVRLKTEGYHVNHVHPDGWFSGPTYIEVPKSVHANDPEKAGWVTFGRTGMNLGEEREHTAVEVCPADGLCAFFPSYVWHGTNPFHSNEHRMTTPCDVLPVRG